MYRFAAKATFGSIARTCGGARGGAVAGPWRGPWRGRGGDRQVLLEDIHNLCLI
jgi:hypothetical protein